MARRNTRARRAAGTATSPLNLNGVTLRFQADASKFQRTVKLVTEQNIMYVIATSRTQSCDRATCWYCKWLLPHSKLTSGNSADKPPASEGFPFRKWNVKIYILDQAGKEHKADCFQKVVFNLHPSFADPTQSLSCPLSISPVKLVC